MINREVTALVPKVLPEATSIAKPEPESASLMKLPFEVLSDVFGFTMTGNPSAALRQASNLAVSHPTLSAVLATPGPEQRTYQRLLAQRLIVQAICDGVPEYLRPQTLLPLIEVLPKAERRALFDASLTWLRQPIHVRDRHTVSDDFERAKGHIGSLMAEVNDLGSDDLKLLLHAAAAKEWKGLPSKLSDASWLRLLSPQAREQVIRYGEENGDIATYLLRHDSQVYRETEFDRLVAAQLSRSDLDDYSWTHLVSFPNFAKKINAERFCVVAQAYGKVVRRKTDDGFSIIKFLGHIGPLSQEQEELLCGKINDLIVSIEDPKGLYAQLGFSAAKMSQSVVAKLVPTCFEMLSDPRKAPFAVQAILNLWHGVDATRREQVSRFVDGHLEELTKYRLYRFNQEQSLAENGYALRDSIIEKLTEGRRAESEQIFENFKTRTSVELNAYVSTPRTEWRHLDIPNFGAFVDQEPELVHAAIVRLINVSNAPEARFEKAQNLQILSLVENISPAFLDLIYHLVIDHPASLSRFFAFMGLCKRADMLGDDKAQHLAQKIISFAPANCGSLLSSAIDLLCKKHLLGAPLQVKLALWCIEAMSSSQSLMYPNLAWATMLDKQD